MELLYAPEGRRIFTPENATICADPGRLAKAIGRRTVLEARVTACDASHNLILDLGPKIRGIIPREEGAIGISEGNLRDIALITRAGKPVAFCVQRIEMTPDGQTLVFGSRRLAQELCQKEYLSLLRPGDILPARVTHLDAFGCFADIGCGIHALLPIDAMSISRIGHPSDRVQRNQDIFVLLRQRDAQGRFLLSMKELLGSWTENADRFSVGDTVCGVIRGVEDYGVFVELTPNLTGLAEWQADAKVGLQASVYIKRILPEKMKIKLAIVDVFSEPQVPCPLLYTQTEGHISRFCYSPPTAGKQIESLFL